MTFPLGKLERSVVTAVDRGLRRVQDAVPHEGSLDATTHLNVQMNTLHSLNGIGVFTNLRTLVASANEIVDMSAIGVLHHLQSADLSCNRIRRIAGVNGKNLTVLDVSMNPLEDISQVAGTAIRSLDVSENPLSSTLQFSPLAAMPDLQYLRTGKPARANDVFFSRLPELVPSLLSLNGQCTRFVQSRPGVRVGDPVDDRGAFGSVLSTVPVLPAVVDVPQEALDCSPPRKKRISRGMNTITVGHTSTSAQCSQPTVSHSASQCTMCDRDEKRKRDAVELALKRTQAQLRCVSLQCDALRGRAENAELERDVARARVHSCEVQWKAVLELAASYVESQRTTSLSLIDAAVNVGSDISAKLFAAVHREQDLRKSFGELAYHHDQAVQKFSECRHWCAIQASFINEDHLRRSLEHDEHEHREALLKNAPVRVPPTRSESFTDRAIEQLSLLASTMCHSAAAKGNVFAQATSSRPPQLNVTTATQAIVRVSHASALAVAAQKCSSVQTEPVVDEQAVAFRRVVEQRTHLEEELRQTDEDARSKISELRDRFSDAHQDRVSMARVVEALTVALDRAKVDVAAKESDSRDLKGLVKEMIAKLENCDESIRHQSQEVQRLSAELHERTGEAARARAYATELESHAARARDELIEYKARVASLQL